MQRLSSRAIENLLLVSGLAEAVVEGGDADLLPPLVELAILSQGLYTHDKAMVYASAIQLIEDFSLRVPDVTPELFFDRVTQEIAEHGQTQQNERSSFRTTSSQVATGAVAIRGLPKEPRRDPDGEHGGRQGQVEEIGSGDSVQAHEEAKPTTSIRRGPGGGDYF